MEPRITLYPLVFTSQRFASWEIARSLCLGLRIRVRVDGVFVKTGEKVSIEGIPAKVNFSHDVVNFQLLNGEKTHLVGGDNALVEDGSAERITITLD
jgi:hypothetical protein